MSIKYLVESLDPINTINNDTKFVILLTHNNLLKLDSQHRQCMIKQQIQIAKVNNPNKNIIREPVILYVVNLIM